MSTTDRMTSLNTNVFGSQLKPPGKLVHVPGFEELFAEYRDLVYGTGLKFTGNQEDAEDITQEVFTKIWRGLEEFNYNSSLKTWIYRIAINTCIDYSRKTWKRSGQRSSNTEQSFDEDQEKDLPSDEQNAEGELLANEVATQVRKAIIGLKPHLKTVLVLKDLEGMSYEEISSVLGLRLGTISSRLNRARKALQAILSPISTAVLEGL